MRHKPEEQESCFNDIRSPVKRHRGVVPQSFSASSSGAVVQLPVASTAIATHEGGEADARSESLDSASSVASNMKGDDCDEQAEDEAYPLCLACLDWQLSSGSRGCLHHELDDCQGLVCGRTLKLPERDSGLAMAARTGRLWSPRCWSKLPAAARRWWLASELGDAPN